MLALALVLPSVTQATPAAAATPKLLGDRTSNAAYPTLAAGGWHTVLIAAAVLALVGLAALRVWRRVGARRDADRLAIAMTDGLTDLNNRHKLDLDVATLQQGAPLDLAVLMIDVDHLTQINDRHGHGVGDEVLRRVAAELRAQMRPGDELYRVGAGGFCAVLRGAQLLDGGVVGERVRAAIDGTDVPVAGRVSVSVGVGAGQAAHIVEVMAHADVALLDAKRLGRNRVEVWALAAMPVAGSRH